MPSYVGIFRKENDMKNIIIGTTFVDIKGFPESEYIERGRNAGSIEYVHGGVARNIAENLGRCGCHPVFVSMGDYSSLTVDIMGRLQREGVETKYMARSEDGLGTWMAIFDDEGDVVASISKRSDMHGILPVMAEKESEIFNGADSVSVEMDMDPDVVAKIMEYAGKYNLPVYAVISNMKIALEDNAFSYPIACLVCNLQEAEMMLTPTGGIGGTREKKEITTGESRSKEKQTEEMEILPDMEGEKDSAKKMLHILKERLPDYPIEKMVVTLGAGGAVYYDKQDGSAGWIPPVPVEVCDTTGAGDAFFSGVVIGLTSGNSLKEACKTGARLASSVIATKENVCGHHCLISDIE